LYICWCRSQWPRGLRRKVAAARRLGLNLRISTGAWMYVCCECCVLSGRGLGDELITRPKKSYRQWCVNECDLKRMRREWHTGGCCSKHTNKQTNIYWYCLLKRKNRPSRHLSRGLFSSYPSRHTNYATSAPSLAAIIKDNIKESSNVPI
jgi:hypothetical protein